MEREVKLRSTHSFKKRITYIKDNLVSWTAANSLRKLGMERASRAQEVAMIDITPLSRVYNEWQKIDTQKELLN